MKTGKAGGRAAAGEKAAQNAIKTEEAAQSAARREFDLTRRTFVKILGAGVLISVAEAPLSAQQRGRGSGRSPAVSARVHIDKQGDITVLSGKVEGGQGTRAELIQAAAEELSVAPERIRLILGDTSLTPDDGTTAGSRTTPSTVPAVRNGAAAVREAFITFAATKFGVERGIIELRDGKATHAASKREVSYADLAADDASAALLRQAAPPGVVITAVKGWKTLGTSFARPNGREIVTGSHKYPSDIVKPDMLFGRVLRPPAYGVSRLRSVDLAPAKAMPGVVAVQDGSFVGVAATSQHQADLAIAAVAKTAVWDAPATQPASQNVFEHLRRSVRGGMPKNPFADELAAAAKTLRASYNVAYVQHTPLETRTALAEWADGQLTVWTGSQNPFGAKSELCRALNVPAERVRVIVPDFGGGFGGKHQPDAPIEAARLARAFGKPVHIRWTRKEELTWAYFRPAAAIDAEATLDAAGRLTSWHFVNINSGAAAVETPYKVAKSRCQSVPSDSPLRQGSYRALAATANNFARESFMDELALAAGSDPLSFRLAHIDNPRLRAVLETAAAKFDFAARVKRKDPGVGVGLACGTEKGSYVAACVEVLIEPGGVAVRKVCEAFECGPIINPANLLSQVQGCIVMGLGPALREEMEFKDGVIGNATLWNYLPPRFADLPELDIHLLNRPDLTPVGAGETPIIAVAPAIANAVFHATGQRIRQMPIKLAKAD